MYKLLLCWRYLLTRYLALACIISVMLGVATLIVVNSVMSGFSTKLKNRLHGLISDVVVEGINGYSGFECSPERLEQIRRDPILKDKIAAMSPTLEVYAMLQFRLPNGQMTLRTVRLIGIDRSTRRGVGGFQEYLVNDNNRRKISFEIPKEAKKRLERSELWRQSQVWQDYQAKRDEFNRAAARGDKDIEPPIAPPPSEVTLPLGIIVGNNIASFRVKEDDGEGGTREVFMLRAGDEVRIITYKGGQELAPANGSYVVADYFKSEMSEYDSNYVFLELSELQRLRGMENRATSIQIKLNDFGDAPRVVRALKEYFPANEFRVDTWEEKQGPLLAAIDIERGILNVLLFLIIGVAGFGILAIFTMIVAEKTRDIGILKALGASNGGVMKIFLGYGLLLGIVGASLGTMLGLAFTDNINDIEQFLGRLSGRAIFDRSIYYFNEIPTYVNPWMIVFVNLGAVGIAVVFSILPALRAAWLHPVRALRYE